MAQAGKVTIEFFGMPRQRAGRMEIEVSAFTVGEALAAVEQACPGLVGLLTDGQLAPYYLLSINGNQFGTDMRHALKPGDHLLLLSADAGG